MMKCPKCSSEIEEENVFCSMCGCDLKTLVTGQLDESKSNKSKSILKATTIIEGNNSNRKLKPVFSVAIIIIGIIACLVFFNAASQISNAATDMTFITSQSGTSIAEIYYQDMGKVLLGFATLAKGFGISILALSVYGGGKRLLP